MNNSKLIENLIRAFPGHSPPEKVTMCGVTEDLEDDFECRSIEKDFSKRNRDSLSYSECSMLIIDSALVADEAFSYFLPRLAKAVIEESGDAFLLKRLWKQMLKNLGILHIK
jgi:hypothetical protein